LANSKFLLGLWLKLAYIHCKRFSVWETISRFESVRMPSLSDEPYKCTLMTKGAYRCWI
jgi:hypothetical protein